MTELLERLRDVFVESGAPAPAHAPRAATTAGPIPRVALLCTPAEAGALSGALAATLARAAGAATALAVAWAPAGATRAPAPAAPAFPGARLLAARLARRDLAARAAGRVVRLDLPADPHEALAVAGGATGAARAAGAPAVVAIAGSRPEELDALLADSDLAVVSSDPALPGLAELALAGVAALGVLALPWAASFSGARRVVAASGLVADPALALALAPALEASA
jgi:hypothetical protein